jgi:hypothetical protein
MNQGYWSDEEVKKRKLANLVKAQEALKQKRAKQATGASKFTIAPITTEEVRQVNASAEHEPPRVSEPIQEQGGVFKHLATSVLSSVTTAAVSYLTLRLVGVIRDYLSRPPDTLYHADYKNEEQVVHREGSIRYIYDNERNPYLRDY